MKRRTKIQREGPHDATQRFFSQDAPRSQFNP
jgi:hypothetical protein